jgi:hypothetical protein
VFFRANFTAAQSPHHARGGAQNGAMDGRECLQNEITIIYLNQKIFMNKIIMEKSAVALDGKATITRDGEVAFTASDFCEMPVLPRRTHRVGRMDYLRNGYLMFVPASQLHRRARAVMREKIHETPALRVEMTTKSFIVHVKLPAGLEVVEMEEQLDDELDNALEVIQRKKEEMGCSIL